MKILIGTVEISNNIKLWSNTFKSLKGTTVISIANSHPFFKDSKYTHQLDYPHFLFKEISIWFLKPLNWLRSMTAKYWLISRRLFFHFYYRNKVDMVFNIGDSLLMNNLSDYKYFKDKGIKIGHAFYGGDVRCWDAYKQEFNLDISTIEDQPINNYIFNRRITRLRKVELFADGIFSVLDQAGLAIRPFHRIYIPFECGKYNFRVQNRDIPVVVHIESRQPYKGEETIYAAVKKLQESGIKFIFKSYKGLTHSEVIDVLEDADILVDEVINFGPGTLGNEAIACGCALAVKVQEGHMARDYFCDIDELNIFQALAEFITNKEKRISSVYKAYDILKSENNLESIANDIIAKIGIDPMDFKEHFCTPSFFLEKYELPAGHIMSKKNKKLTRMVIEKFYPQNPEMINSLKLRNLI